MTTRQANRSITQDRTPEPVQPPDPARIPQQPAIGAGLTSAMAQGAARSITARLVDKFLTNPPDWLMDLWHALKPWE
ncbi:hypothetical protein [Streptomyces sp. 900105245]